MTAALDFTLTPYVPARAACLVGPEDANLRLIAGRLGVAVSYVGAHVRLEGPAESLPPARALIEALYRDTAAPRGDGARGLSPAEVHLQLTAWCAADGASRPGPEVRTPHGVIKARTPNQAAYLRGIATHPVTFGIGPAGTGKTFLAVAAAVSALESRAVRRLILTRPAVEAGERLGFLPGDLAQKIDPYLRPLSDALLELMGAEKVEKQTERHLIEIAPLAYMRGRTLNDAFIILDEAQNTTEEQMKMFLTRIGFNSQAVITGDPGQSDLPRTVRSGLRQAVTVLSALPQVAITRFTARDVVRHPVVAAIIDAYAAHDRTATAAGADA